MTDNSATIHGNVVIHYNTPPPRQVDSHIYFVVEEGAMESGRQRRKFFEGAGGQLLMLLGILQNDMLLKMVLVRLLKG